MTEFYECIAALLCHVFDDMFIHIIAVSINKYIFENNTDMCTVCMILGLCGKKSRWCLRTERAANHTNEAFTLEWTIFFLLLLSTHSVSDVLIISVIGIFVVRNNSCTSFEYLLVLTIFRIPIFGPWFYLGCYYSWQNPFSFHFFFHL